jgi:hypothetical protein
MKWWITAIVAVWFLLALGGSLAGVFAPQDRPPLMLATAAAAPVVVFAFWYAISPAFRHLLRSVDLRLITLAQTWRVGGILFVILYYQGVLPGVFALPAGWGDFAIGVTAPIIAWVISARDAFSRQLFLWWNSLGILDLVLAVSLGTLASATSIGVLAGETTTQVMGAFPLSLIPTFFVPLFVILHLAALVRVSQVPALHARAA